MTSVLKKYTYNTAHGRPLVGDTKTSVLDFDHLGWVKCDGRSLNKNDYLFLWNVIGYSFGGSGNSFSLPAPAGRVVGILGEPDIATGTNHTMGQEIGAETHTLILSQIPSHNHTEGGGSTTDGSDGVTSTVGDHQHTGTTNEGGNAIESETVSNIGGGAQVSGSGAHTHTFTTNGAGSHSHTINSNGGNQPHNNMQPTLYVGNLFIYCGKPHEGRTVLQTGLYF